jgi:hypothetical protein
MKHAERTLAALLAALVWAPAAAQNADPDAAFRAASQVPFSAVAGQSADAGATQTPKAAPAAPKSCADAKELETTFQLTVAGKSVPIELTYADCDEEPRNDYLPPYTQREYKGTDGYGLAIVTDEGSADSDVLVSKGKDWVGRFGKIDNKAILSGKDMTADSYTLRSAKPAVPVVPACEAALPKPVYGDNQLWLLTKTKAYYYREDCDICAELDSCDLQTHVIKEEIRAHAVDCSDLTSYKKGADVLYDFCAK